MRLFNYFKISKDPNERRVLGGTGIEVSELGLGTVKFGRNEGVKYPKGFALPCQEEVTGVLELCRDLGINLLDTAPAYGLSEERIGRLLPGRREDWVLCGKAGEDFSGGVSHFDFSARGLRQSLERSLKRLRTDYLDLLLVHSDGRDVEILSNPELGEMLDRAKSQGLIRAYGISTKTVEGTALALEKMDVVMLTYNPWTREEEVNLERAEKLGRGVLVKKALGSGWLGEGAQAYSAEECLEFCLKSPAVGSVVVGSLSPDNIRANAQGLS
ncbi:MAG: aldo/keto reductase [Blastochloris sp.]|nr:aldo/keto reductase [Blastochloris sp.]